MGKITIILDGSDVSIVTMKQMISIHDEFEQMVEAMIAVGIVGLKGEIRHFHIDSNRPEQ